MSPYTHCILCPRQCGVDRTAGQLGYCGMPGHLVAAHSGAHYWEEPVISGSFGSGAVFFTGCTLGCVFCQNEKLSREKLGQEVTARALRKIFEARIAEGCQNINLVTPTHFLPTIIEALTPKLPVPVVYNCGGYERVETLRRLEELVDIYLPDMKYMDGALAGRLSEAKDYPAVAQAAILEMLRQTGPCEIVEGELRRGTIVRHLVLPGYVENSLSVVEWLAQEAVPRGAQVSLMAQYVPMPGMEPPLDRPVTPEEYAGVLSWAELCGIRDGYFQDLDSASRTFIPDFTLESLS